MENIKQNYKMATVLCAAQQELSRKFCFVAYVADKSHLIFIIILPPQMLPAELIEYS